MIERIEILKKEIAEIYSSVTFEKPEEPKLKENAFFDISKFVELNKNRFCSFCNERTWNLRFFTDKQEVLSETEEQDYCCKELSEALQSKILELRRLYISQDKISEYEAYIKSSGVGVRFAGKDFSNYVPNSENSGMIKTCVDYIQKFEEHRKAGLGLMFVGNCGNGKTHLAIATAKEILKKYGVPFIFGSFSEIIQNMKSSFDKSNEKESESRIIEKLSEIEILIIDDLGKENISNYVKSIAYQVINRRYCELMPMIITTNDSGNQLEEKYDPATISRLRECCLPVVCNASDYRTKIAKERKHDVK